MFIRLKQALGYYGNKEITFGIPYLNTPRITVSPIEYAGYWHATVGAAWSSDKFTVSLAGDTANTTQNVDWIAIGRWK